MTGLVLTGFDYFHSLDETTLLGAVSDLTSIYNWIGPIGPSLIITDINPDDVKKKGIYTLKNLKFLRSIELVYASSIDDFETKISEFIKPLKRIFFYYSGHAVKDDLVLSLVEYKSEERFGKHIFSSILPIQRRKSVNKTAKYPFKSLTNLLLRSHSDSQLFVVMDCCAGDDFNLPFYLDPIRELYTLKTDNIVIPRQKMVVISSSLKHQSSLTKYSGSFFTQELLNVIKYMMQEKDKMSYLRLINELGTNKLNQYSQYINIHASRPYLYDMWHWLFLKSTLKIELRHKIIMIDRN